MHRDVGSTFYLSGAPRAGSSSLLPLRCRRCVDTACPNNFHYLAENSKLPKIGTQINGDYLIVNGPSGFSGTLASNLRRPELRFVLQRAEGRLQHATDEEVHRYLHLEPHPNVSQPCDVLSCRGVPVFATPFEPEGNLKLWVKRRVNEGHVCWSSQKPRKSEPKTGKNPYALIGYAPVWGPHTLRPKPYQPPKGKSMVYETLRRPLSEPSLRTVKHDEPTVLPDAASPVDHTDDSITIDAAEIAVRARIALHIARGLSHLHSSGFLHLDVNPWNVLVTQWAVPKSNHPKAIGRRKVFYGAKVTDFRAVTSSRLLHICTTMFHNRAVTLSIYQPCVGKNSVKAVAADVNSSDSWTCDVALDQLPMTVTFSSTAIVQCIIHALEEKFPKASLKMTPAAQSVSYDSLDESFVDAPRDVDFAKTVITGKKCPQAIAEYAAPEQEALLPHHFLVNDGSTSEDGVLSPKTDVFSFGLVLCYLISGYQRKLHPLPANNGLKFLVEPVAAFLDRAFPPALLARNRLLDSLCTLAQHCLHDVPSCRPTAAVCASLLESALEVAREVTDPSDPHPLGVSPTPKDQDMNEARYFMYARDDYDRAAQLLLYMFPDASKPLVAGTDWKALFCLFRTVKQELLFRDSELTSTFPYFQLCMQARGFPGALRFQLFPIHDACRWNAMDELKDIVAGVGDSLCPAVIRDLMDKFWKSDQPYIRTLRSLALATGRKSYLSLLLEEADGDGETPLRLASKHASVHVVRYLVELGASVNAVDGRFGETALHRAAEANNAESVWILMQHGACCDVQSAHGSTPLHVAASRGNSVAVDALLAWGADMSIRDIQDRCPVHLAVALGHVDVVASLIKFGCSVLEKSPCMVGPRINDSAPRMTPLELAHHSSGSAKLLLLLDDATRRQTSCNRRGCNTKVNTFTGGGVRCELCRKVYWCSPKCQIQDNEVHGGSCSGKTIIWPKPAVVTPWGAGTLLCAVETAVVGDGPAVSLSSPKKRRGVPSNAAVSVPGKGQTGPDIVKSALIVVPRGSAAPIQMFVNDKTLRVYLGLEAPSKVTYDLSRLKPVMKYSMPSQYDGAVPAAAALSPTVSQPSLSPAKLSKVVASFRTRKSRGEPHPDVVQKHPSQAIDATTSASTVVPPPTRSFSSVFRSLSPSKRQVSTSAVMDAGVSPDSETPSKGLVGKFKSVLSLSKR